jgi:HEAT repeat protein
MPHGKIILTPAAPPAKDRMHRGLPLLAALMAALILPALLVGAARAQPPANGDEEVLKKAGVATDAAGLLAFFRQRTASPQDQALLEESIRQLDGTSFRVRENASARLVRLGGMALPALKKAMVNAPLETVRRAQECIRKIERGPGPELPAAAARLLVVRQPADAVSVLLAYLPFNADEMIEEEVLASLGALGVRAGHVDPRLVAALKDAVVEKRAAAAYVLAQSGGLEQRAAVRRLLTDPDPKVRDYAASGLVGKQAWRALQESPAADEAFLREHKVPQDAAGLVQLLRKHSPDAAVQAQIKQLLRQLGSATHRVREEASLKLARHGPPALAFLKDALADPNAEVVRRAALCIEKIQRGPGPALPVAVIRLLPRRPAVDAIPVLLGYLPFAEDESVEEEALNTLCLLSVRPGNVDPLLTAALNDPLPARRGAAAYVLGKVGTRANCAGLAHLLRDPVARVRFRAAQGLLAGGDALAVPELISLVAEAPPAWGWQVDELLVRLAGDRAPPALPTGEGTDLRKKTAALWATWWKEHKGSVDVARLGQRERLMGLTLICEYDSQTGRVGGRVWETGRDGRPRWQLRDVLGPMDAQVLPGGRLLVAENMANRITERDQAGVIKWEFRVPNNPIACQRLPNGNTFIATYTQVMEVSPTQQVVYSHGNMPGFYIFSARRMRNGHIVCMTAQGAILELDSANGQEVRRVQMPGPFGGWCSAEALPNGRFLVAVMSQNKILEVDAGGKAHWEANYPGVFRATRLPNGNTLVVSMTNRRVAELDRAGTPRWEVSCEGRPWMARFR